MEDTTEKSSDKAQEPRDLERRKLLKLLAAGGAVTAVTMLPGKWSSPVIKSGVLPAHAQVSPSYEVVCDQESVDFSFGDLGLIFFFSATAWETVSNTTVANVLLGATIATAGPAQGDQATTDASGVANFEVTVPRNDLQPVMTATVQFVDQSIYGADSCTIQLEAPPQ